MTGQTVEKHLLELVKQLLHDALEVEVIADRGSVQVCVYFDGELIDDDRSTY
jgi:hypothetical protein